MSHLNSRSFWRVYIACVCLGLINFFLYENILLSYADVDKGRGRISSNFSRNREIPIDWILAVVDDEPITASSLKKYLNSPESPVSSKLRSKIVKDLSNGKSSNVLKALISKLIRQIILEKEANKYGVNITEQLISKYISQISQQNNVSVSSLLSRVEAQGLSVAQYKAQVKEELLRSQILSASLAGKVNFTSGDIDQYLEDNPSELPPVGSLRLERIHLPIPENADLNEVEAIKTELWELRSRVGKEISFSEVLPQMYINLGYVEPKDLRKEITSVVSTLRVGEISSLIHLPDGIYVFRLLDKFTGVNDKIRQRIRQKLIATEMEKRSEKYFEKELPRRYDVQLLIDDKSPLS